MNAFCITVNVSDIFSSICEKVMTIHQVLRYWDRLLRWHEDCWACWNESFSVWAMRGSKLFPSNNQLSLWHLRQLTINLSIVLLFWLYFYFEINIHIKLFPLLLVSDERYHFSDNARGRSKYPQKIQRFRNTFPPKTCPPRM